MCARAMANFGLDDLRLVNPREGWPRTDEYRDVAYAAAAGATAVLDFGAGLCRASRRRSAIYSAGLCDDGARARADEGGH